MSLADLTKVWKASRKQLLLGQNGAQKIAMPAASSRRNTRHDTVQQMRPDYTSEDAANNTIALPGSKPSFAST